GQFTEGTAILRRLVLVKVWDKNCSMGKENKNSVSKMKPVRNSRSSVQSLKLGNPNTTVSKSVSTDKKHSVEKNMNIKNCVKKNLKESEKKNSDSKILSDMKNRADVNSKKDSQNKQAKSEEKSPGCKMPTSVAKKKGDANSTKDLQKNERKSKEKSSTSKLPTSDRKKMGYTISKKNLGKRQELKETKHAIGNKGKGNKESDFAKIEKLILEGRGDKSFSGKRDEKSVKDSGKDNHKPVKRKSIPAKISSNDVDAPVLIKRGRKASIRHVKKGRSQSDSDMSDWEEVGEGTLKINETEALLDDSKLHFALQKKSVKIELDTPESVLWGLKKRKRRCEDERVEEYMRKFVNRAIRGVHENMHKTHLLCLFAHGQYINKVLNSEALLGSALSLITDKNAYPPKRLDINYLEKFVNWFSRKIKIKVQDLEDDYWNEPLEELLLKRFSDKTVISNREFVFMFVIMLRALGLNVRLVLSLQPVTWKPNTDSLIKKLKKDIDNSEFLLNGPSCSKFSDNDTRPEEPQMTKVKNSKRMLSSESDVEINISRSKETCQNIPKHNVTKIRAAKIKKKIESDDSDSDFDPNMPCVRKEETAAAKYKKRKSEQNSHLGKNKRDSDAKSNISEGKRRKTEPLLEWAEVYVEEEEKWISIDIIRAKIHCIPEIESRTPSSSAYITAYNANLSVRDVTRRYIASWLSNENK
ncbi:hypothetical protein SK128_003787, partial [Halocaridina rubra]